MRRILPAIRSRHIRVVANAGGEGPIVVQEVKKAKGNSGYNVASDEYVDMVKAGIIDPTSLGHALEALTGFAVAVILFDGGLNLNIRRIRGQAPVIQRLLSLGVVITTAGAAGSAERTAR